MTNEDFLASHQLLQPLLLPLDERNKAFPLCGALQVNLPLTSPSGLSKRISQNQRGNKKCFLWASQQHYHKMQ